MSLGEDNAEKIMGFVLHEFASSLTAISTGIELLNVPKEDDIVLLTLAQASRKLCGYISCFRWALAAPAPAAPEHFLDSIVLFASDVFDVQLRLEMHIGHGSCQSWADFFGKSNALGAFCFQERSGLFLKAAVVQVVALFFLDVLYRGKGRPLQGNFYWGCQGELLVEVVFAPCDLDATENKSQSVIQGVLAHVLKKFPASSFVKNLKKQSVLLSLDPSDFSVLE